ncbi:hypothetical protein KR222_002720, partial [Zaprionus bogoriensis]
FGEYSNLVDSLHIVPRLMVQRRRLRKNSTYGLTLMIRNNALYPRKIKISSDSPSDTTININDFEYSRYLETDGVLSVKISIRSKTDKNINRTRQIYVESFHPNIVFQVPIIVLQDLKEPYVCEHIEFPKTVPKDLSYYEIIIYNPLQDLVHVRYRRCMSATVNLIVSNTKVLLTIYSSFKGLTLNAMGRSTILSKDYARVLLSFEPAKLQEYKGFFNVKFGLNPPRLVVFDYTPKSMSLYVNRGYLSYGKAKFTDTFKRSFNVCNETHHMVNVSTEFISDVSELSRSSSVQPGITNKMFDEAISMHSVLLYDFDDEVKSQKIYLNEGASNHFQLNAPETIDGYECVEVTLTFHPVYDDDTILPDNQEPPFIQRTRLNFCFTDSYECMESHYLIAEGEIDGIEVEVYPKLIDFRKIYLGEEHCAFIKVLNVDGVTAKVKFKDSSVTEHCIFRVTPTEGFVLEPCERGIFHLSFYTTLPTTFAVELHFKVENGVSHNVWVKGSGQNVQLRTFPHLVEFGTIPFAVPQKRFMLLMNPLAVPITLQVYATEDGEEQPLVFNIRDSSKVLPITIKDPIKDLQKAHEDMLADVDLSTNIQITTSDTEVQSVHSYELNDSVYSLDFEESVMEPIPTMATQLLKALKKQKIFDKSETDKRVIQEAMLGLMHLSYFSDFTKHNNFIFMDWNAIPSDPKEIYCDDEIIYLRPNTGRSITILIIPNRTGYYHRSLTVRICPAMPMPGSESSDNGQLKSLIKSEFMCSKLWFEYYCCTPEIDWQNCVDLTYRITYAGEEYTFDIPFSNLSNVGGFLHFDVIPNEMSFRDGVWKYYIGSNSRVVAKCQIMFRELGKNKLSGLVKIVGDQRPYPFHIFGNVLPCEIRITPKFVHRRIQVFELNKVTFYIDNVSPTSTKLLMKLRDNRFQYMTTMGGVLAPTGQSMYTTLVSYFTDPDLYQNTLYIDLQFDHIMELSITFLVEGVPIYFTPNIREGFDAGLLFTDLKADFQANIFKHRFPVKATNRGGRTYRVSISRLKIYSPALKPTACTNQPMTARFEIVPKLLELPAKSEQDFEILISGYEEGEFYADFMLDITDTTYPQRKHVIKVTVKATFAECELCWDRRQLTFIYKPCKPLKETAHVEIAELVNNHNAEIEQVLLEATGPFRIKSEYEHIFEKQIVVRLGKLERKEIFVLLNKATVKQLFCRQVESRVAVFAMSKLQKHLALLLDVQVPEMHILTPHLVLFDQGRPFDHNVQVINHGCSTGNFKWKRVEVCDEFIGDDDTMDVVAELLSQLLLMLEYNFTCEEETNMTLRYQQCRCQFKKEAENGSLILDILDEIINELDIERRRFMIPIDDVPPSLDDSDRHSSSSFIQHTIDTILDRLNLESSQNVSGASSDYCFSDRFIYFYEKTGALEKLKHQDCLLHLPHIRRLHEMKTSFRLEVVGGESKLICVTLVNVGQTVKFQRDNIYLSIRPWYETYTATFRVSNITNYPLDILLMPKKSEDKEKQLIDGYAKLVKQNTLCMEPLAMEKIKVTGILGLNDNFVRLFGMLINDSAHSTFRVRGQGILPILTVTTALPKVEQTSLEIAEEYQFLRLIYNYETFKSITVCDDEHPCRLEEDLVEELVNTDFFTFSDSDEELSNDRQKLYDLQIYTMVRTYVQVNNNQELPNATVLDQMLVTERYLHQLRVNPDLYDIHRKVYQNYRNLHETDSYKGINPVQFTVQPLPCEHLAYVLDLGPLARNTLRRFELRLHFFGPGKLIASARTAARIPGLYVDFSVDNHFDKKFIYWAEKCTTPEYFNNCYRNMWERLLDADKDPRVNHAHSFDLDKFVQHKREITDKDRRQIEEYYNSLNRSVYPDHKHHFTLAKVITTHNHNFSGVEMRLVGLFKPESQYYERDQRIVDYIYIDLHMGPTLPILLRGVICS